MQWRKLALLTLVWSACADTTGSEPGSAEDKLAARNRHESAARDSAPTSNGPGQVAPEAPRPGVSTPPSTEDVCLKQKWYGDGECDAWCPRGDAKDCTNAAGDVACATFFSPADGRCNPNDPCGPVQDEDCQKTDPGTGGGGSTPSPTQPAGDGKCEPRSIEELKLDPDCANLICPALFSPADGKCNAKNACDFLIDEDCSKPSGGAGGGVICTAIAYATNGKCEAGPGCEANDPVDCGVGVACDAVLYPNNGKCEAPAGCEANDPKDCSVACIDVAYTANGKCEAAPGCEANDPKDCAVICLAILYPENGKCEAARGCESSDPDC